VCSQVLVSLLVSGVFWDEVKVFSADDESSVHLGGNNGTGKDTATDGDETGEWALLVCTISMLVLWPISLLKFLQDLPCDVIALAHSNPPSRPLRKFSRKPLTAIA